MSSDPVNYGVPTGGVLRAAQSAVPAPAPAAKSSDVRPTYYGGVDAVYEPWKVMQHTLTKAEYRGYLKGTALAYLMRGNGEATPRSNPVQDAAKAATVLNELRRFDASNP